MFSDNRINILMVCAVLTFPSCVGVRSVGRIVKEPAEVRLDVAEDFHSLYNSEKESCQYVVDSSLTEGKTDGPLIMNAIRDTETGEMVATDIITASKVTSRFLNVAERNGKVTLMFDITVPGGLLNSDLQLRFFPSLTIPDKQTGLEVETELEPVYITGANYRKAQLRGYERYEAFLKSIITDSSLFVRRHLLDIFLKRHFPQTYLMKNDSSFVSDTMAESLFGVSQKVAIEHYTRHYLKRRNEWKMKNKDKFFRKYVKDPIRTEKIRLDTVFAGKEGEIVYRYAHEIKTVPGLRKALISLDGEVCRDGQSLRGLPQPDNLTYYISSLSTLVDNTPRYVSKIIERVVFDNTNVFLDFEKGSAELDTLKPGNASELKRLEKCFADISSKDEFVVDSIIVTTSCSLEGSLHFNRNLSQQRSHTIRNYVKEHFPEGNILNIKSREIPENWKYFKVLVKNDSIMTDRQKKDIMRCATIKDLDVAESSLSVMDVYPYLRRVIYPKLRTVCFDFHLHRKDMQKDTIHTTELDTVYMKGVEALKNLEYKNAARMLKSYGDYNSALAMASSGYDNTALSMLDVLPKTDSKVCYLEALVLSRLGRTEDALESFKTSVQIDSFMIHRANLDPEMADVVRLYYKSDFASD